MGLNVDVKGSWRGCLWIVVAVVLLGALSFGYKFAEDMSQDARGMMVGFFQAAGLVVLLAVVAGVIIGGIVLLARRQDMVYRQQPGGGHGVHYIINAPPAAGQLPPGQMGDPWMQYGAMPTPAQFPAGFEGQRRITAVLGGDESFE